MVQDIERVRPISSINDSASVTAGKLFNGQFPATAPAANPVFYRTYSRKLSETRRESWDQVCERTLKALVELGKLSTAEAELVAREQRQLRCLPSGRWLWVGGTDWITRQENFSGAYNCTSTNVIDWEALALMMDLAMMGAGTGAIIEPKYTNRLPAIRNKLVVSVTEEIGTMPADKRVEKTTVRKTGDQVTITVGDCRRGWVDSYLGLLEISSDEAFQGDVVVSVDLSNVRPAGEKLKGFGGVANPIKLPLLYERCANILNKAVGRQLTSIECCLLIDEAAACVVAGNIRRSAGMRQGSSDDTEFATAKDNLWSQGEDGNWRIDPERDALRMANHTRVFHHKPSAQECKDAVQKQFYSGEGAIQYAPEAIARSNADLLNTRELQIQFIQAYETGAGMDFLQNLSPEMPADELEHRLGRYGLNPCGEILGEDFHCNLSEIHLNQIDPQDFQAQEDAFRAGGLAVASLLNHQFIEPRYQRSRQLDPIVGVSFTGFFDFCVNAFGVEWLKWWEAGRPDTVSGLEFKQKEQAYLSRWKQIVHDTVADYCKRHGLHCPNRCTTVQPAGTKSLLTGASSGWHPPKAQRFIRRITFGKNDPVALACRDFGYSIVPSQSDKDDDGNLLNDPFDPRCTEWLVELPVEVPWANLPGADQIAIEQFSALAQFDFYMQVQKFYTAHNTSATIELREDEVDGLSDRITAAVMNDEGYISAALLARFDAPFPRLPFEKIDHATYLKLQQEVSERRLTDDFYSALSRYDSGEIIAEGPAGCDSDKCMLPEKKGG
ncbi:ribonucleoside-triphosphate reductase, adenosylcobalamin-dependent [filamentous cyanobacterium LEGE 11480]|uniref:Ribonucleoside-triphosphate reductase, adenosylcobalamin-dependent n=1 Tax=Romeriopsis navalis LEGE 11480 TaxID=2777977 RepID=A0A928VH41_9CYAN|nr:ribonucleoside-triphosphate reductase, adenosylcobalamin-dependent [Romeriopsis navalis]MBE9028498.1 ribonucleoside-triphosphate reductase, adenosylcobalamin-dependent [Romeriopsis navalis LEGE 11480]